MCEAPFKRVLGGWNPGVFRIYATPTGSRVGSVVGSTRCRSGVYPQYGQYWSLPTSLMTRGPPNQGLSLMKGIRALCINKMKPKT